MQKYFELHSLCDFCDFFFFSTLEDSSCQKWLLKIMAWKELTLEIWEVAFTSVILSGVNNDNIFW